MFNKTKKDSKFPFNSPKIIISQEPIQPFHENLNPTESAEIVLKTPAKPLREPIPYTPPDALMFDLFSAIQRKTWVRARRLCYELILCDPSRKNYYDLYEQIDQIIDLNNLRARPSPPQPAVSSRKGTADVRNLDKGLMSYYEALLNLNYVDGFS